MGHIMKELTAKQKNILDYIEDFIEQEGMAPTVYEIADFFKIKTSTVFAHLRALQRKSHITGLLPQTFDCFVVQA